MATPLAKARIDPLRQVTEGDVVLMENKVRYSALCIASRLAAKHGLAFEGNDMDPVDVPSFLRQGVSEGRGKRWI